ncbi:MAG TPA: ceramide glucosyltransferase [Thermoanaerobaculaceae bacterium]|nr:ceramide glucosyltransferase [Thermoanaerobaculaceae bacterium]
MGTVVLLALVGPGLALAAVMALAQKRLLRERPAEHTGPLPPVSILKPMRGADPGLAENLESFFRLDYPEYELLLGVDDGGDPALAVASAIAARHPDVPCRLVADRREVSLNPKVNNLANIARRARHEVLWISDSNTRVPRGALRDLVARLERPGVGLVSSPFRGTGAAGVGGACESLQLNTFVMGGVAAMHRFAGGVCVVGKSMVVRRSTVAEIGGFQFLGRFLAEDQVSGEEVARLGLRVDVATSPVDNVLGTVSLRAFLARHLRWARIRRRMSPAGYAGELLLNPVFLAACGAVALRTPASAAIAAVALAVKAAVNASAERAAGVKRPLALYPALTLLKDLLVGAAWAVPFASSTVAWRGRRFHIGHRTALSPETATKVNVPLAPASVEPIG